MPDTPREKKPRALAGEFLLVDPRRVVNGLTSKPVELRQKVRGPRCVVMGGNWHDGSAEIQLAPIDDRVDAVWMRKHFQDGVPWEDIPEIQRNMKKIDAGRVIRRGATTPGISNSTQYLAYLRGYDDLYASIRDGGYKTQAELGHLKSLSDIRVGIDEKGHLFWVGGLHRLIMTQVMKLQAVPMRLVVRHEKWDAFRKEIERHARDRRKGRVYQRIDHPDLAYLEGAHDAGSRLGLVAAALADRDWSGKRLLDLGTHWGHWPQQMEKLGFDCVGIEMKGPDAEIAEQLRVANEGRYSLWKGDLTTYPDPKADVVLALSIFHHLVTTDEKHARLVDFLGRLETPLMFFEPPTRNFVRYEPEEFVAFVSRHARLPNAKLLGVTNNRPLYMLSR